MRGQTPRGKTIRVIAGCSLIAITCTCLWAGSIPIERPLPTTQDRRVLMINGAARRLRSEKPTETTNEKPTETRTPKPLTREQLWDPNAAPPAAGSVGLITILCGEVERGGVKRRVYIKFRRVPASDFILGSAGTDNSIDNTHRRNDEGPQRYCHIDQFYFGQTEVTQEQYEAVMGSNPSYWIATTGNQQPEKWRHKPTGYTDKFPVDSVSLFDARDFCLRLNRNRCWLPTEPQWEFAARGQRPDPAVTPLTNQKNAAWCFGSSNTIVNKDKDITVLDLYAWYVKNSDDDDNKGTPSPHITVKGPNDPDYDFENKNLKKANNLNLFGMHGNVAEWTTCVYNANAYNDLAAPNAITPNPSFGNALMMPGLTASVRGGRYDDSLGDTRTARRRSLRNTSSGRNIGFRCTWDPT